MFLVQIVVRGWGDDVKQKLIRGKQTHLTVPPPRMLKLVCQGRGAPLLPCRAAEGRGGRLCFKGSGGRLGVKGCWASIWLYSPQCRCHTAQAPSGPRLIAHLLYRWSQVSWKSGRTCEFGGDGSRNPAISLTWKTGCSPFWTYSSCSVRSALHRPHSGPPPDPRGRESAVLSETMSAGSPMLGGSAMGRGCVACGESHKQRHGLAWSPTRCR